MSLTQYTYVHTVDGKPEQQNTKLLNLNSVIVSLTEVTELSHNFVTTCIQSSVITSIYTPDQAANPTADFILV